MFDLPILVEILGYLSDRDTFHLALTNWQFKKDISELKKNRCDECSHKGMVCTKRKCAKCPGYTCWSKALTYIECISKGDERRIEKKIVICDKCGVFNAGNDNNYLACQICNKISFVRGPDINKQHCSICEKRTCFSCSKIKWIRNDFPSIFCHNTGVQTTYYDQTPKTFCLYCYEE